MDEFGFGVEPYIVAGVSNGLVDRLCNPVRGSHYAGVGALVRPKGRRKRKRYVFGVVTANAHQGGVTGYGNVVWVTPTGERIPQPMVQLCGLEPFTSVEYEQALERLRHVRQEGVNGGSSVGDARHRGTSVPMAAARCHPNPLPSTPEFRCDAHLLGDTIILSNGGGPIARLALSTVDLYGTNEQIPRVGLTTHSGAFLLLEWPPSDDGSDGGMTPWLEALEAAGATHVTLFPVDGPVANAAHLGPGATDEFGMLRRTWLVKRDSPPGRGAIG